MFERRPRLRPFLLLLAVGCASSTAVPQTSPNPSRASVSTTAVPDHRPDFQARHRAADARREELVDSILALMTLEEKLGQLNQPGGPGADTGPAQRAGSEEDVRAGRIGSFLGVHGAANTRSLQRIAVEESRLGIPLLFAYDVIHGFRTIFPVPLAEAASFDPEAVERASRIAAIEASADGITWTYAPMVDIARDPRWGRVVEGAGEDPYLGSVMAAARVRGFQGDDLSADNTILATAKHFVAYGAAEGGRDYDAADVSERTLREIYLPPFHAAVEAGVGSVMAAFNEVAGTPMHAHDGLIDGLLREEWGWDGILVSDYTGIMELLNHRVAADSAEAGALALRAGVDVDMISRIYLRHGAALVADGRVDEGIIDDAVRRVLRAGGGGSQYQEVQGVRGTPNLGWGFNTPSDNLEAAYEPGDPRQQATILYAWELLPDGSGRVVYYNPQMLNNQYNQKVFISPETPGGAGNGGVNIRRIRYAHVLLNAAEAAYRTGREAEARTLLNQVRARARGNREVTLGIQPEPLAESIATNVIGLGPDDSRVFVRYVPEGSPADNAGLREFTFECSNGSCAQQEVPPVRVLNMDIIQSVGGIDIQTIDDYFDAVDAQAPGSQVAVEVLRVTMDANNAVSTQTFTANVTAQELLPDVTASGQALLDAIWHERRVELAMEQHRWFDIIRQGRAAEVMAAAGKTFQTGVHELYPIPLQEITLTGLQQNPGYN
ncbi:MAG: RagB/SusD family nutrient uptake outer membrane protein [Candidatus Cloacimonetes bacterium]|nr:RagB/SusD family nutrient uptake outer membrane protein [Candidatus Cloacimonadota bacterium]